MKFIGDAIPLTLAGLRSAANTAGVEAAALLAIVDVESQTGCGFLPDKRPVILFERHVFSREMNRRSDRDAPDISNRVPGGYGAGGAHQYDRLAKAMAIDELSAVRATSWGLGQIMGHNYATVGHMGEMAMIRAFCDSEDAQMMSIAMFVRTNRLRDPIRARDWAMVARVYNGKNYAMHDYDGRLDRAYLRHASQPIDLTVRANQVFAMFAGLDVGRIDGIDGPKTRSAFAALAKMPQKPTTLEVA